MENLNEKLENAEREIEMLKIVRHEEFSPIPQIKLQEEENSIALTPANRTVQIKSRTSSNDGFMLRSIEGFGRNKLKKAGAVIGDLVLKLKSARKFR